MTIALSEDFKGYFSFHFITLNSQLSGYISLQGTFNLIITSIIMAIYRFTFKKIIMMELFKKTHPGTIGTLIVVGIIQSSRLGGSFSLNNQEADSSCHEDSVQDPDKEREYLSGFPPQQELKNVLGTLVSVSYSLISTTGGPGQFV